MKCVICGKEIEKRIIKIIGSQNTDYVVNLFEGGIKKTKGGYSENLKENNTSINNININNKYICEFEELWNIYPKKVGKKDALRHYIRARKSGVSYETILNGLNNYNEYIENQKTPYKYIKDGSSWFNQESWNDERAIEHKETEEEWLARMEREIEENEHKRN